jgi:hypothetical protein
MIKRFINWVSINSYIILTMGFMLVMASSLALIIWSIVTDPTNAQREQTEAKFKKEHGNLSQVIYCRDGFLIKERVVDGDVKQQVIMNEAGYPTRCGSVTSITVKETAKTGLLVGNAN